MEPTSQVQGRCIKKLNGIIALAILNSLKNKYAFKAKLEIYLELELMIGYD